jgi:hypothetical protein
MLDDLVFYLRTHATSILAPEADGSLDVFSDPDAVVGTFVRKIITSHYLKHTEHLRAALSATQRTLSRKHDLASLPMEKVEELWSDVQAWERRMGEYCEDLESIMLQLGIPLKAPKTAVPSYHGYSACGCDRDQQSGSHTPFSTFSRTPTISAASEVGNHSTTNLHSLAPAAQGEEVARYSQCDSTYRWLDSSADFQFLLVRFRELRHRTECLNGAVTGLASITANRQACREQQLALEAARRSIREAKSSRAVTLLGLVFIPLAYTSSVFSMSTPYGPGEDKFWQYFAASAPLILVVLVAYYALDMGYADDGTGWSVETFLGSVRRVRRRRMGRRKADIIEGRKETS